MLQRPVPQVARIEVQARITIHGDVNRVPDTMLANSPIGVYSIHKRAPLLFGLSAIACLHNHRADPWKAAEEQFQRDLDELNALRGRIGVVREYEGCGIEINHQRRATFGKAVEQ